MELYIIQGEILKENILSYEESAHCIRVMRHREEDVIFVTDGHGNLYEAVILDANPHKCLISASKQLSGKNSNIYSVHIAISPVKSSERFEWFVEKSVETGINTITPLICKRSERKLIRKERLEKCIIASMKQALILNTPVLNNTIGFEEFLNSLEDHSECRLIAHCEQEAKKRISDAYSKGKDAIILIGPEGDFTREEIKLAKSKGFIPVTLGDNRLRTETAGILACHSIHLLNNL